MKTDKNSWKVTDKDINKLKDGAGCSVDDFATPANIEWIIAGIKLAQKNLVEWGMTECDNTQHPQPIGCEVRFNCKRCWQELCMDMGLEP